jgi:hypothetical protein
MHNVYHNRVGSYTRIHAQSLGRQQLDNNLIKNKMCVIASVQYTARMLLILVFER